MKLINYCSNGTGIYKLIQYTENVNRKVNYSNSVACGSIKLREQLNLYKLSKFTTASSKFKDVLDTERQRRNFVTTPS